jgi:hypothetical protein
MRREDPGAVALGTVFHEQHGRHVVGAAQQRWSLRLMLEHLPEGLAVSELTLAAQEAAVRRMRQAKYAAGTIKRAVGAAKAAVGWAWRNGELERPVPFISVPEGQLRERVLSIAELARLWMPWRSRTCRCFSCYCWRPPVGRKRRCS